MFEISSFVEQEDALLGVLTVRETVTYALRLQYALPRIYRNPHLSAVCRFYHPKMSHVE